jgi:hypothetical protein
LYSLEAVVLVVMVVVEVVDIELLLELVVAALLLNQFLMQ